MKKVLIVDDDQNILEVIKFILTSNGFEVRTHSTGLDVYEVVLDYHPNLILLDIRLPGKLGTEICKELKQIDSKLPIVLFSAHAEKGKALGICGADDFLEKPFDIGDLIDTINLHVN